MLIPATNMKRFSSTNQGFAWFQPLNPRKEYAMNTVTHYVLSGLSGLSSPRNELDPLAGKRSGALPKRVYRWGVDGPWLLAWGSDGATDFSPRVRNTSTFAHWFRRESKK
jgi:hypothetical protein